MPGPDGLPPHHNRDPQVILPNLINLTERDLFSREGGNLLHITTHTDDYAEVELSVRAEALPIPAEGLPSTIGLIFNGEYRIIRIQSWTYNKSPPTTGSRYRDQWGRTQTEILHQGVEYYDIRGTVEFPPVESESSASAELEFVDEDDLRYDQFGSVHTMRNPQSGSTSTGSRGWNAEDLQPLTTPPAGMPTNEVICKYCRQRFAYPIGLDVEFLVNSEDNLGLVVCRACFGFEAGKAKARGNSPEPEKPKKRKNLYSRKLRIRRKE